MASTSDRQIEDKRLLARVEDAFDICERRCAPHFIGFLDERQAMLIRSHIPKSMISYRLYGGHDDAERVIFGAFPSDMAPTDDWFPLTAIAFVYGIQSSLSHRDVLGALLGCGISREKVGDILCADEFAVAFIHDDLVSFVAKTIRKIGNVGVKVICPYDGDLPLFHRYLPLSGTVASARLDAVLKVLLATSREKACEKIREAVVLVDHKPALSPSQTVCAGQILSIRGSGRFVIDDVSQTTKKGRLILKARQYV